MIILLELSLFLKIYDSVHCQQIEGELPLLCL